MKSAVGISVMGPKTPCNNCRNTRKIVFQALSDLDRPELKVTVQHLELNTPEAIEKFGVLKGPVVFFDEIIAFEGKVPSKSEMIQALKQYMA